MSFRVWVIAGTRPEIVKLAPVARALRARSRLSVTWVSTGQHTTLADQACRCFQIEPELALQLPRDANGADGVAGVLGRMILALNAAMAAERPDMAIVQGDTTSAIAGCLAAFGNRVPVAHVEAGLRTYDLNSPYPEEAWRTQIAALADLNFAPTRRAAENLARENVPPEKIMVTGNTVIDALHWLAANRLPAPAANENRRTVLVTLHRRENWNGALDRICEAVAELARRFADVQFEFVAHANPVLYDKVHAGLSGLRNVRVLEPLDYCAFVDRMRRAVLVMSDSGGVQEEAPAFGVPVMVLRNTTERPESVEAGVARLVGTDRDEICAVAGELLSNQMALSRMARVVNPFGDGQAAPRIAEKVEAFLAKRMELGEGCKPAA